MPNTTGFENVYLTDDVIAKEAMKVLKNSLVAARLVHRDHESRLGTKLGGKISIRKPQRFKSTSGRTLGIQPMVDQSVAVNVDNQENIGLNFTTNDRTLSIEQFSERYIKPAVTQMAHKVDLSIVNEAKNRFFFSSGSPGTAVDHEEFIDAAAYMSMVGVPDDGMCHNLLNPLDAASYRKALTGISNEAMVKKAIERQYLGYIANSRSYETAQMVSHTVGALGGTPLVDGASQTGFGATQTLNIDGASTSVTDWALAGDTFTIAGVYEINPQTYQSTGRLQRFVVTEDADSDGSGDVALTISPSINDGNVTTTDTEGNTVSLAAYQNVDAAAADNAALTFIGTAGTTYRQNLIMHRDAIALAVIDLEMPRSAPVAERVKDEDTGLSMLMTAQYNITDAEETYRLDVLWAVDAVYPELGHRVWSA